MTAAAPSSICVLRLSAIGDTCHTLPVIRCLQATWPQLPITWIIGKTEASLMRGIEGVELIEFDKRHTGSELLRLRRQLAGREFDYLLHMQIALRASVVSRMVSAKARLGFDRPRARNGQHWFTNQQIPHQPRQHVMDGLLGFARFLGADCSQLRWDIPLSDDDRAFAANYLSTERPSIVISPCSSQRANNFRNWPVARFVAVAKYAIEQWGAQLIITGGRTELEQRYAAEISRACAGVVHDLVGKTTLKQLLALIAGARAVICPDSGPAHMAAAVNTPVIGLYASSNPQRSGPYHSLQWTVNKYPEAVQQAFSQPVTAVKWGQRVRDPAVMELIQVTDVCAKLQQLFAT